MSVYGVKSYSQIGPDLSNAAEDVHSRFGKTLDEFWHEPVGTMVMVRSQVLKLTPEQEAVALEKLKAAFAEYQRQKQMKHAEEHKVTHAASTRPHPEATARARAFGARRQLPTPQLQLPSLAFLGVGNWKSGIDMS